MVSVSSPAQVRRFPVALGPGDASPSPFGDITGEAVRHAMIQQRQSTSLQHVSDISVQRGRRKSAARHLSPLPRTPGVTIFASPVRPASTGLLGSVSSSVHRFSSFLEARPQDGEPAAAHQKRFAGGPVPPGASSVSATSGLTSRVASSSSTCSFSDGQTTGFPHDLLSSSCSSQLSQQQLMQHQQQLQQQRQRVTSMLGSLKRSASDLDVVVVGSDKHSQATGRVYGGKKSSLEFDDDVFDAELTDQYLSSSTAAEYSRAREDFGIHRASMRVVSQTPVGGGVSSGSPSMAAAVKRRSNTSGASSGRRGGHMAKSQMQRVKDAEAAGTHLSQPLASQLQLQAASVPRCESASSVLEEVSGLSVSDRLEVAGAAASEAAAGSRAVRGAPAKRQRIKKTKEATSTWASSSAVAMATPPPPPVQVPRSASVCALQLHSSATCLSPTDFSAANNLRRLNERMRLSVSEQASAVDSPVSELVSPSSNPAVFGLLSVFGGGLEMPVLPLLAEARNLYQCNSLLPPDGSATIRTSEAGGLFNIRKSPFPGKTGSEHPQLRRPSSSVSAATQGDTASSAGATK